MSKKVWISIISIVAVVAMIAGVAFVFLNPSDSDEKETTHIHGYGEWKVTRESTCENQGEKERSCSCGAKEVEVIPTSDHTWGEWQCEQEPTCLLDGTDIRTCIKCQLSETKTVDMLSHVFGTLSSQTVNGNTYLVSVCNNCGILSDEKYEYEPIENQEEGVLFECAQDFSFEVFCPHDEAYILDNLVISNVYF